MPKLGDLLLVHMLEPQPVGSYFDVTRYPLHITLLHWFGGSREQLPRIRQELLRVATTSTPVTVTVGEQAMFGPEQDVPVNVIADQAVLQPLHDALLSVVRQLQLPLETEAYVGQGYRAHITRQPNYLHADPGQQIAVADIQLVQLVDDHTCQVVADYPLKGSDG